MSKPLTLEGEYYTVRQCAEILDLTKQRIHQLCNEGSIPYTVVDEVFYMIKKTDLDAYKKSL